MRSLVVTVAVLAIAPLLLGAAKSTAPSCAYRDNGALPDPACTPGATNPAVTQQTIKTTICTAGYTATIRPAQDVTETIKRHQMAAYGNAGKLGSVEEDHLISLELGGAPADPANLWPEPHSAIWQHHQEGSFVKDKVENRLHREVCAGKISLAAAQTVIASDWMAAP